MRLRHPRQPKYLKQLFCVILRNVKSANATAVKNQFGRFLEKALTEPIAIRKTGRRVAVLLAWPEYERLSGLEDERWARKAAEAEKKGYLGPHASATFLRRKLNEKT